MKQISIEYSDEDEGCIARNLSFQNVTGFGVTSEDAVRELKAAFALVEEILEEENVK